MQISPSGRCTTTHNYKPALNMIIKPVAFLLVLWQVLLMIVRYVEKRGWIQTVTVTRK